MKKVGLFPMVFIALFFMVMGANSQSFIFSNLTSDSVLQQNTTLSKPIKGDLIETLGKLKETKAIPYLIEHITFSAVTDGFIFISPMSQSYMKHKDQLHPAQDALVTIGEPVIPSLLNEIQKLDSRQSVLIETLEKIAGSQKTLEYLGQLIKEEKDETKRSKLERWRKSFEH